MKNFYEVLGISKNATSEEINKAYRQCARKHHPDVNPSDSQAAERFREVQEAYETLIDPVKRRNYEDNRGFGHGVKFRRRSSSKENPSPAPGFSFDDLMGEFFGGSSFKGRNISIRIEIELKEVVTGTSKNVKIKKRKVCTGCTGRGFTAFQKCTICDGSGMFSAKDTPFEISSSCPNCGGTGKASVVKCGDCAGSGYLPGYIEKTISVAIPVGIENGMQLRIIGEGEDSLRGGNTGDIIVFVLVKEHDIFAREGYNLSVEVPVSYTQLVLGEEIDIPTINHGVLKVKIPPGSQSHTKFRMKGKGVTASGDLVATLKVETPKNLDEEYSEALKKLSDLEKKNITPRREQWSKKIDTSNK